MGVLSLIKNNISKYRYDMLSYTLIEYFCGLDDVMHIIDGTVDLKNLDLISFMKCGLIKNRDNIVEKIINGTIDIDKVLISDEQMLGLIDLQNIDKEFEEAINSFIDSFKIDVNIKSKGKEAYYDPKFYRLSHDWEGLRMIYISKNIGTDKDFYKCTLGEIMTQIGKYCEIESGKYSFNRYEKTEKSNDTADKVKELIKEKYGLLEEK